MAPTAPMSEHGLGALVQVLGGEDRPRHPHGGARPAELLEPGDGVGAVDDLLAEPGDEGDDDAGHDRARREREPFGLLVLLDAERRSAA